MDYKKLIIDMVKQMKNEGYLRKIYIFVKTAIKKERDR